MGSRRGAGPSSSAKVSSRDRQGPGASTRLLHPYLAALLCCHGLNSARKQRTKEREVTVVSLHGHKTGQSGRRSSGPAGRGEWERSERCPDLLIQPRRCQLHQPTHCRALVQFSHRHRMTAKVFIPWSWGPGRSVQKLGASCIPGLALRLSVGTGRNSTRQGLSGRVSSGYPCFGVAQAQALGCSC